MSADERDAALWLHDLTRTHCPSAVAHGYQTQVPWEERAAAVRMLAAVTDATVTSVSQLSATLLRPGFTLGYHLALMPTPQAVVTSAAHAILAVDGWLTGGGLDGQHQDDGVTGYVYAVPQQALIATVTGAANRARAGLPFGSDPVSVPAGEMLGQLLADQIRVPVERDSAGTPEFLWYLDRYTQVAVVEFTRHPELLAVARALAVEPAGRVNVAGAAAVRNLSAGLAGELSP